MATSGSYNYSLSRDNLIIRSLQKAGLLGENETTVPSGRLNIAVDLLNAMLKQWQKDDIQLWALREATVFTAYQDYDYSLGLTGDHATESYVSTTISSAEAAAQTALSVTSTTGMTAGDYIGIELDSGTRQWTTISNVNSATLVTVSVALTGAAAAGNTVVSYTNKIDRPLDVLSLRSKLLTSNIETPSTQVDYIGFREIPDKTTAASNIVNAHNYNPSLTTGTLLVWPRPSNVKMVLNISYSRSLADMDSSSDDFDLPQEYTKDIMVNLAYELASFYNMDPVVDKLKEEAQRSYMLVKASCADRSSISISPNVTGNPIQWRRN